MANQDTANLIDVVRLLGDVSTSTVERILETGGSCADLEVAYFCVLGDGDRQEGELGPLAGKAAQILDILSEDPVLELDLER